MAAIAQTAHPQPRPLPVLQLLQGVVVDLSPDVPEMLQTPDRCLECGQDAVAFEANGSGWCTAHAPLELFT